MASSATAEPDIIDLCGDSDDEPDSSHDQKNVSLEEQTTARPSPPTETHQCWVCQVGLRGHSGSDHGVFQTCYSLHAHPTLGVPSCSVCAENIPAIDANPPEDASSADVCFACGEVVDGIVFICDTCPRTLCEQCLVRAHRDSTVVETLSQSTETWSCLHCQPTPIIRELQLSVQALESQGTEKRPINLLLQELEFVESEKAECLRQMETETDQNLETEIRNELQHVEDITESDLNERVRQELDTKSLYWKEHLWRLEDTISILQDDLERRHNYDLKEFYRTTLAEQPAHVPSWKNAADNAIAEREANQKAERRKQGMGLQRPDSPQSDADDIEELEGNSSQVDSDLDDFRSQWRHSDYRATPRDMEKAMVCESERLLRRQVATPRKVTEEEDRAEMIEEDRQRAVTAVRHDFEVALRLKNKRSGRAKERAGPSHSGTHQSVPETSTVVGDDYNSLVPTEIRPCPDDFTHSSLLLSKASDTTMMVSVATNLAQELKPHQKEGIEFIFKGTFADLADISRPSNPGEVGGTILAHQMGLGKSFACVALVHTLLYHPALLRQGVPRIRNVLLVCPTNVLQNWEDEFEKWTSKVSSSIPIFNISNITGEGARLNVLSQWRRLGGVLVSSDGLYQRMASQINCAKYLQDPGPDMIVLDESHTMLKNSSNKLFKSLLGVKTPRRLCLTGSPFQNNLFEYFRMISYVRPGLLGNSERMFEREYAAPIGQGTTSDASEDQKRTADKKLSELKSKVEPFIHRRDASVLLQDLPPMQQVVLVLRRTKLQNRLYSAFSSSSVGETTSFWKRFHHLGPVNNHPGCLLRAKVKSSRNTDKQVRPGGSGGLNKVANPREEQRSSVQPTATAPVVGGATSSSKPLVKTETFLNAKSRTPELIDLLSDDEGCESASEESEEDEWWMDVAKKVGFDQVSEVKNGNKVVLLLHILIQASRLKEKVVLFSQSLTTLDFISEVLAAHDWSRHLPGHAASFAEAPMGGWKLGKDFLRIDGSTSGADRGTLIKEFNQNLGSVKLFLISSRAGGIGINLTAANRVILFDSSFNPTVDAQALYRCYRYGQTRDVFAYRFLTEGTMEEKVYSRAVTKSNLANTVIDGRNLERFFTRGEVEDITKVDNWVLCERCEKWRVLPQHFDMSSLPDKWYCEMMNEYDRRMVFDCNFPERESWWWDEHFKKPNEPQDRQAAANPVLAIASSTALSPEKEARLIARDNILKTLVDMTSGKSKIVSRLKFHEALIRDDVLAESEDGGPTPSSSKKRSPSPLEAFVSPPKRRCGEGIPGTAPEPSNGNKIDRTAKSARRGPRRKSQFAKRRLPRVRGGEFVSKEIDVPAPPGGSQT